MARNKNEHLSKSKPSLTARKEEYFSGPIPPPEHFERYDLVLPGAADRILTMAEGEQKHRHLLENKTQNHETFLSGMYIFLLFMVIFGILGLGTYLLMNDKEIGGIGMIITAVLGGGGIFKWIKKSAD